MSFGLFTLKYLFEVSVLIRFFLKFLILIISLINLSLLKPLLLPKLYTPVIFLEIIRSIIFTNELKLKGLK